MRPASRAIRITKQLRAAQPYGESCGVDRDGSDATRIYGDPNPTFSFTFTGFVNGDTAAVVTGSPACTSADPTAAVGTYPITCTAGTLSAANYTFAFVSGT